MRIAAHYHFIIYEGLALLSFLNCIIRAGFFSFCRNRYQMNVVVKEEEAKEAKEAIPEKSCSDKKMITKKKTKEKQYNACVSNIHE